MLDARIRLPKMLQICRTCLQEIVDFNYISLCDATSLTESFKAKDVLAIFVPELALDIIGDPVMCAACMTSLHVAYDFRRKCLRTEERIRSYVHRLVLGSENVDIIAMVNQENDNEKEESLDDLNPEEALSGIKMENPNWLETNQLEVYVKEESNSPDDNTVENQNHHITSDGHELVETDHTNPGPEPQDTDSSLSSSNADSNLNDGSRESIGSQWLRRALESTRKQHVCSICKKIFDRRSSLYLHRKIHELDKPFRCTICNYSATQRCNLTTHMRGHTGEKPYTCDLCNFRMAHHSSIKHHMKVHTGKKPYSCGKCDFNSSFKYSLEVHSKEHEIQNQLHCTQCDFQTNQESFSLEHAKSHPDTTRKCAKCDFIAEHPDELQKHLKHHGKQKCFKCNECDYSTTIKCNLQRHQVVHGGQKTLKCSTCSFTTSTSLRLRRHIRMHLNKDRQWLYKSQKCNFVSPNEKKIKSHQKIHNMEQRPFKCTECDYAASCQVHIIKHMRTHTGEKPYKCDLCDFTASHTFSLKRHMTIHSDEKPFKCSMCNYMAKRRTYLLDHIRTHTGEKPYKCHMCSYSSSRKPLLLTHLKAHEELNSEPNLVTNTSCSEDETVPAGRDQMLNEQMLNKDEKVILEENKLDNQPNEMFTKNEPVLKQLEESKNMHTVTIT